MSQFDKRDGYYDETGQWQRTKFCFVYCGPDRCTCMPPGGLERIELHPASEPCPICAGKGVIERRRERTVPQCCGNPRNGSNATPDIEIDVVEEACSCRMALSR